jgi:hypothetical protein
MGCVFHGEAASEAFVTWVIRVDGRAEEACSSFERGVEREVSWWIRMQE